MENHGGRGRLTLENIKTLLRSPSRLEDEIAEKMSIYTGWAGIEDLCLHGGSAHDVEVFVTVAPYTATSEKIVGTYTISFEERHRSPCRDRDWATPYTGTGALILDVNTGVVDLETVAQRQPTRDEIADRDAWLEEREMEGGESNTPPTS